MNDAVFPVVPKLSPGPVRVEVVAHKIAGSAYKLKGLPYTFCAFENRTSWGITCRAMDAVASSRNANALKVLSRYSNEMLYSAPTDPPYHVAE